MIYSFVETTLHSIVLGTTMSAKTIDALHRQGYSENFSFIGDKIISRSSQKIFLPRELNIDNVYCCDDEGCEGYYIYALSNPEDQLKGILTNLLPPDNYTD